MGLTRDLFRYTLVSSAIKVVCVVVGSQWGVIGVAAGYTLAPALSWPISLWWLSRRTDLQVRRLYGGAARILTVVAVSASGAGAVAYWLRDTSEWVQLPLAIVVTVAVYALFALVIPAIRRDLSIVIQMMKLVRTRR